LPEDVGGFWRDAITLVNKYPPNKRLKIMSSRKKPRSVRIISRNLLNAVHNGLSIASHL
jgi:hypothetical protein